MSASVYQTDNHGGSGRSGAEEYLRVLFPRSWDVVARGSANKESGIASGICRDLWAGSERARARAANSPVGREEVVIDGRHGLLDVTAIVCLDCAWVAWDDKVVHPWGLDGTAQEPDVRDLMGAMRVARTAADMGEQPWGPYFDTLYPSRLVRDFVQWKRFSTGVNIARRLWEQRHCLRAANPYVASALATGAHIGVVLDAVPLIAHAACTTCTWLDGRGVSMTRPDWRGRAAAIARQHEIELAT